MNSSNLAPPPSLSIDHSPLSLLEVKPTEKRSEEWWNEHLGAVLGRDSGATKKESTFELTMKQRRELLLFRTPTKEDKLIWSVPLPEGSYPPGGLPIWERLYLDRKLPMIKCPPNALIFARQQIGKKLWKDTEGQEFILYDPRSYEVAFSYENVHDPHLTTYYEGKEIRGFLVRVGDATEDGWGLCSLKKFNQYRRYLRRVHLSLVHSEIERQEALKNQIYKIKEYKQTTMDNMNTWERKVLVNEMRASIIEALKQQRIDRIKRIEANIKQKEERVKKLQLKREKEKEIQRQRGLKLLAEQELKNKIATEIKRRKKIATLRKWHDKDEKTARALKKQADERVRQKAEKVRLRWQNKIDNLRKMLDREDECLKLQQKVREENIKVRNARSERNKQKEKDQLQKIRRAGLKRKALAKIRKAEKRMENAIIEAWVRLNPKDCDLGTEIYRVKKSINTTMEELLTAQTEGPDRYSIILMSRNRIQKEQKIPIQVSFAIDAVLEKAIRDWAITRLELILETVIASVKENGRKDMSIIKARYKDIGIERNRECIPKNPRGKIYQQDPKAQNFRQNPMKRLSKEETSERKTMNVQSQEEVQRGETEANLKKIVQNDKMATTVIPNYVHYGPVSVHEYPFEYEPKGQLKSVADRPKTPMPSQEELCKAGFLEERLNDILPTLNDDVLNLKEKKKFRKTFQSVAVQLYKQSSSVTKAAFEPSTRFRTVNKLVYLGDTERTNVANILCSLIMNKKEKKIYDSEEFEWLTKVVAREAIKEVLNPPEFRKEEGDGVARTKIMFYAPNKKK